MGRSYPHWETSEGSVEFPDTTGRTACSGVGFEDRHSRPSAALGGASSVEQPAEDWDAVGDRVALFGQVGRVAPGRPAQTPLEGFEVGVDHGRDVERQELREDEAADDGESRRPGRWRSEGSP